MILAQHAFDIHGPDASQMSHSPNARRRILEDVLRNGAEWGPRTADLIAKIRKRMFTKTHLGSKAAKHAERLDQCGEELDDESATLYRAWSARLLYLNMDKREKPFCCNKNYVGISHILLLVLVWML